MPVFRLAVARDNFLVPVHVRVYLLSAFRAGVNHFTLLSMLQARVDTGCTAVGLHRKGHSILLRIPASR